MASQAQQVHIADLQHVRVGPSVRNVTRLAALKLHRFVFKRERPLFVRVAGVTNHVLRRRAPELVISHRAVRIVAVGALHQLLIHAVMERHFELSLLLQVTRITKLRLRLGQQEFRILGMVRRVARRAGNIALRVQRVDCVHVLRAACMARQAALVDFFRGMVRKNKNFRLVAATGHVLRAGPMASFASLVRWSSPCVKGRLPVRRFFPAVVNLFVAGLANFRSHKPRGARRRGCGGLCLWGGGRCRLLLLLWSSCRRRGC